MRSIGLIIMLIFFLSLVGASCDKNQVDVNSASLEKLDEITGVGPTIAQNIISARPYISLDDMIRVSRIGEITLQKIKDQGLACVEGEIKENISEIKDLEYIERQAESKVEPTIYKGDIFTPNKNPEPILLNKEPKSELVYISKNAKVTDNLVYAFSIFLIFIIGILIWERF